MNVNTPAVQTAAGIIGLVNASVKTRTIQNVAASGNPLYIRFGGDASNLASDTIYHVVLAAGNAAGDGLGGSLSIDVSDWAGVISVYGVTPRFIYTELT